MNGSMPEEFDAFVRTVGVSFVDFGNGTQGGLDELMTLPFSGDPGSKLKLQSIW